ncbi:hypothetical protein ACKKBG_A14330 [Auxenochlorella protothecoides x Auxenochlorella symbiontica]
MVRSLLLHGFAAYAQCLRRYPLRTQVVSTGALWAAGDALAQRLDKRKLRYDMHRTLITAAYGAFAVGPIGHVWYHKLDSIATRFHSPGSLRFVALKVLLDTVIFSPLHILGYFGVMNVGERGSWADFSRKVEVDFVPTLAAELAVWPAIQAANFKFIRVDYQLLAVNLLTIFDSAFMSWCRATEDWMSVLFPGLKSPAPARPVVAGLGQSSSVVDGPQK